MFTLTLSPLEVAARAAIVFIVVVLLLRLVGKRQIGQMTPSDLTVLLLVSEGASNAIRGDDQSITAAALAIATMLGLNALISFATARSKRLDRWIEGKPETLIRDGRVDYQKLWDASVSKADLLSALREQGCVSPREVKLAVLETNGQISVTRMDRGG